MPRSRIIFEAKSTRLLLHFFKFDWQIIPNDRQMLLRRTEVLPDGEHVAVDRAQIDEGLTELVTRLAEANHQARFGVHGAVAAAEFAGEFLGALEDF